MHSTPPQPPQPRPSHPPHPVSPGPAHAATLPTAAASPSVAPPHTCASVMPCRRLPARHVPARWACAPPPDTPGTLRPCRTHLSPLAQVWVPEPWRLPLSHAPSYLPTHAINTTTAPATAPVAPPSPRQSWSGARRQAPDRCSLPVRRPPAHLCLSHVLPHAASAPRPRPLGMRAAPRHARHPAPVPHAPDSVGPGVGAEAMVLVVVPCALVPATPCKQLHHSSRNRARRTPLTPSVLVRRTPPRSRPLGMRAAPRHARPPAPDRCRQQQPPASRLLSQCSFSASRTII